MGATVRVSFEGGSLEGHWWGGLVKEQLDASGMLYRRNRYYDAATGRFSQIDPIGIAGGLNLYGFADGDPVNYSDPFGLCAQGDGDSTKVEVCEAVADIPLNDIVGVKHVWFRVGALEAGLGQEGGGVPGEGGYVLANNSPFFTQTEITDHAGRGSRPGATCRTVNLGTTCVTNMLRIGQQRGSWTPTNHCQTFVAQVIAACSLPGLAAQRDMTFVARPRTR
jgi:RHS repeat-associated protein